MGLKRRKPTPSDGPKAIGRRIDGGKRPWRSQPYKKYVKTEFACLTCQGTAENAHHIRECFPRTMGVRISDVYVVPLCERCHGTLHARSRTFWTDRHISPEKLRTWCESVHAAWKLQPPISPPLRSI